MSKSMRRLSITLVAAAFVAAATALAGPAGADPPKGLAAQATCSDGNSYDVVVPGHASYPPAHILTSTQVFKPVAFGGFTTTVIGPDGSVIATETTEAITKAGGTSSRTIPSPTSSAPSPSGWSHPRVSPSP